MIVQKTDVIGTFVFGVEGQGNHLYFSPITRSKIKVPLPTPSYVFGKELIHMTIGYARVSTIDQNLDRQIDAMKENGAEKIFTEKVTGKIFYSFIKCVSA